MIRHYSNLKSKQGVQIEISYVTEEENRDDVYDYRATGVSFVVEASDKLIKATSKVTLVLINRAFLDAVYKDGQQVWQVPLRHSVTAEGLTVFDGGIMGTVIERDTPASSDIFMDYQPQVAVVIDGVWQIDPVQPGEQHNFNFAWNLRTI